MASAQSGLEALILGIPVLGILLAGFFRLDEVMARPKRSSEIGRPLSHRGKDGASVCIEPDGRYTVETVRDAGNSLTGNRVDGSSGAGRTMPVRRVSVVWEKSDLGE